MHTPSKGKANPNSIMSPSTPSKPTSPSSTGGHNNGSSSMIKWKVIMACCMSFMAGFLAAKQHDSMMPVKAEVAHESSGRKTYVVGPNTNIRDLLDDADVPVSTGAAAAEQSARTNYMGPRLRPAAKVHDFETVSKQGPQQQRQNPSFKLATTMMEDDTATSTTTTSERKAAAFAKIFQKAYNDATAPPEKALIRHTFDIQYWMNSNKTTQGGLEVADRILLAKLYSEADSVFEYGLGESTYMADYVGVPRYAGIDSDPVWVNLARTSVSSPHYRFYFADIGPTKYWGYPADANLAKNVLNYQLQPLWVEQYPFDVYMVDGRWRLPTALACFLHASARGAPHDRTTVLLHDCPADANNTNPNDAIHRIRYKRADHLIQMVQHSGARLCVYKRRPETTNQQLIQAWLGFAHDVAR